MEKRCIAILGSTGSIGRQTLDVVRAFPDRFRVVALAARGNIALLAEQAREFAPEIVAYTSDDPADAARSRRTAPQRAARHGGADHRRHASRREHWLSPRPPA